MNESQYGPFADAPGLDAADYKLNVRLPDGSSAYTFCMCPGGYVVAAASEEGGVVTNGMSDHARDGENANAALLVTLNPADFPDRSPLGGMRWQRQLEQTAFRAGGSNYRAPAQLVGDFLAKRPSHDARRSVRPTYRPGVTLCELHDRPAGADHLRSGAGDCRSWTGSCTALPRPTPS
ncbi:MAG: FAD-dependent protein [Blautia wexlerae]